MKTDNLYYDNFNSAVRQLSVKEKFLLLFKKKRFSRDNESGLAIVYKKLNGKIYIIDEKNAE